MEIKQGETKLPARLLPVSEVAYFFGVHPSTIRRWEREGLLKSYAIGPRHNLRFKQEDVLNFLEKRKEGSIHRVALVGGPGRGQHKITQEVR